jgi:hypothetical protein
MITVAQNLATRRWGFRIIDLQESENKYDSVQRILYEDLSYPAPQDAFQLITQIKKSLEINKVKVSKDESNIYGYTVYDDNNVIIMGEGGWTNPTDVQDHLLAIKKCMQGEIKMNINPPTKKMALNTGNNFNERSSYTDPTTGITKEYGGNNANINLGLIQEQERLDLEAEVKDNLRILGE